MWTRRNEQHEPGYDLTAMVIGKPMNFVPKADMLEDLDFDPCRVAEQLRKSDSDVKAFYRR